MRTSNAGGPQGRRRTPGVRLAILWLALAGGTAGAIEPAGIVEDFPKASLLIVPREGRCVFLTVYVATSPQQRSRGLMYVTRMDEFEGFMAQFGFWRPDILAPFAIFWQIVAGLGFIFGLLVRPLGLITAIQFVVAVWMVHWTQDFAGWWPALILVFLGLYFGARGAGRYGLDTVLAHRAGRRPV